MPVSVDNIAHMSDPELAQFIEHRGTLGHNGHTYLSVDGWNELPKAERHRLRDRLK